MKSMQTKPNYFKADLYRLRHSGRFCTGMLLVYAALMFNSLIWGRSLDVLIIYFGIRTFSTHVLVYIGCVFPFATVFAEDMEHKSVFWQIGRGSVPAYVLSKVSLCFTSSVFSMAGGTVLFVLTCHLKYPLCDTSTNIFEFYVSQDIFGFLLASGHHMLYFMASACLIGMFGGLLALISMYLSLFLKNKLFVICFPMMGHYFIDNYIINWLQLPAYFSPVYTFNSEAGAWDDPLTSFLYACSVSLMGIAIVTLFITSKIRKDL